jgi:hypothetical protein
MEDKKNQNTSSLVIEINIQDFNSKGELIDTIVADSKLTKADSGRQAYVDEDSITVRIDGCGCPKVEIDVNSISEEMAEALTKDSTLELNVKAQKYDFEKKALIDAIASGSKLTKADAGREAGQKSEDWFNLKTEAAPEGGCPKTEIRSHSKTTKADAGKTA